MTLLFKCTPVEGLLAGLVAPALVGGCEWLQRLDFSNLEPLSTERMDPSLRGRTNDLLWCIRFRNAAAGPAWMHMLVALKFQFRVDRFVPLRVQGHVDRTFPKATAQTGSRPTCWH